MIKRKINEISPNADNPRVVKGSKFQKLVKSIKEFPEMLLLRPIIVDENDIILGGNMRYLACKELRFREIPVKVATGLSPDQKKEFIIKDNVGFGEWDWDILANDWDEKEIKEWGLDVWQPEEDIDDLIESAEAEIKELSKLNDYPLCPNCNTQLLIGGCNDLDEMCEDTGAAIIQTNAMCDNSDCEIHDIYYNIIIKNDEQNRTT
jgi:hypothetical protein